MPNENEYFGGSINPVGGFGLGGNVGVGNIGINPVGAFNVQTGFNTGGNWSGGGDTALSSSNAFATPGDSQSGATTTSGGGTPSFGSSGGGTGMGLGGSNGGGTSSTASFTPNALSKYAQVAYHWKLMTRGDGLGGGAGQNIVIAESGVTGYNIREVHIDSIVAPNSRTKNTNAVTAKIVIAEPMGSSFLDGLYEAVAKQAGAKNWQQSPYILQLYFLGYDESGAQRQLSDLPNNGQWSWELLINNIDVHLETSGGVFTLDCLLFNDVALRPEWMNVQEMYAIDAMTVGDLFKKLAEKLNKMAIKNYETDMVTYVFQFHAGDGAPAADKFKLQDANGKEKDSQSVWAMREGSRETPTYNVTRGVQIADLIEQVIAGTKEGQELAIYGKSQGGQLVADDKAMPKGEFRDSVFYRVYPQIKYTDYHQATGNYKRTVIFHVKPFRTQATTMDTQETVNNSQKALQAALPRTKKRYEYIYTGLNTEVLNFDIKFNVVWQGLLPRLRGGNYYNETSVHHAKWDSERANDKHLGGTGTPTAQQASNANNNATNLLNNAGRLGLRDSAQGALNEQRDLSGNILTQQDQTATALNTAQQELNNGLPKTEAERTALFQKIAALRNTLDNTTNARSTDTASNFGQSSDKYAEEFNEDAAGAYTQVSMIQNAEGARRNAGAGVISHRSRHRSIVGALLNQIYDPSALMEIELDIMGDPFWLGGPPEQTYGPSQGGNGNTPNYTDGDTCFCLYFRYPFNMGDSGQPTFRDQDIFNGLYRVITVKHSFVGGKFTQTLKSIRMQNIHPKDVKALADSSNSTTTPGTSTGTGGTA